MIGNEEDDSSEGAEGSGGHCEGFACCADRGGKREGREREAGTSMARCAGTGVKAAATQAAMSPDAAGTRSSMTVVAMTLSALIELPLRGKWQPENGSAKTAKRKMPAVP